MTFEEILPYLRKGGKIRRKSWEKTVIQIMNGILCNQNEDDILTVGAKDLLANDWEVYEEPIDWDYIIKNKCPCWFWNKDNSKYLGTLAQLPQTIDIYPYKVNRPGGSKYYKHCCPVSKDEITFYKDKK